MLRHACGFKLANDGHDTRALRAYLGHKNIQHTVRYAELSEGFLARLNEQEPPAAYASCQLEPSTQGPLHISLQCNDLSLSGTKQTLPSGLPGEFMSSRLNAPCTRERGTWLEPDQVLAGPKCIRRTGHRLNGQAATAYVRQRVATEEHQITVALVHPERDLSVVVRISEHHARQTILISLEVGERMVERCRADRSGFPKIIRRAFRGFRADRKTAFVGLQDSSRRYAQYQRINICSSEG